MQDDNNNITANASELTETAGTPNIKEIEITAPMDANAEPTADATVSTPCEPETAPVSAPETAKDPLPPEIPANCKLIGIRFKTAGELYYVPDENMTFTLHERIVVKLAKGKDLAEVALLNPLAGTKVNDPHIRIIRRVNESDIAQEERNRQREKEAFAICNNKIKKLELPMKLLKVQYIFDGSRVTFFFKADSKVDFRKLVRELAFVFRTRIELRQIGPRDETEMLGGLGICGRRICCNYWPCRTKAVINVDTQKNPFLNVIGMQSKVSGLCSRPLCCLRYEGEAEACKLQVPPVNAKIIIDEQTGILKTIDEASNQVTVEIEGEEIALNLSYEDFLLKIQEGKVKPFKEYKPKPDLPFLKKENKET
ncbi:MAG TPA: regulatory iron-sulfur-containing complex subunit RicT, partial [Candidatus Wallbacteria bacterium]|nr:regulatory iron-sulfur-containing complex subunit RicT [Candidatus Wallbacteria bacterium]